MARSSPPRKQRPLNRDVILDAATDLVEREGESALSMRRLGAEVGVEGMSLYHHFSSREELLRGIADRLFEPLASLELGGEWRSACCKFATGLREVAVSRPASFRLAGMQPLAEQSLRPVEVLLEVLVGAGFDPAAALAVYRAVVSYARGYALAEASGFTVDAAGPGALERLRALPLEEFPVLAGRAEELVGLDPERAFALGLGALLDGLTGPER